MPRSGKVQYLSEDEILATITHSSLPTVITEGRDDVIVWRRLEDHFAKESLTLIPAGCRSAVLKIFGRRHELPPDKRVVFLADLDLWVMDGVPAGYESKNLIFTTGYSVENDMFKDGELRKLLTYSQARKFSDELVSILRWYALAVARLARGESACLKIHPNHLLDNPDQADRLLQLTPGESFPHHILSRLSSDADTLLRGKTLLALLLRHTDGYSYRALLNIGASRNGPCYQRIVAAVGCVVS